jgi:transposase
MVEQRTALANQLRSLLAEYGFTIPVGILRLQQQLPELIEDASNSLTFPLRRLLSSLREDMQALNERITSLDREIAALSSQQITYRHLLTIPGVGPLIAAAFLSAVDATQFSSGRELSAWCGLVPRQYSSGGKQRLSSVTKNGNRSLSIWLQRTEARRGFLKTTVALANMLTRIIWRVLTDGIDFNMQKAVAMN